jgi:hypothetical protein
MSIEIEFDPLLLDCVFVNYDKVKDQFTELVNKKVDKRYIKDSSGKFITEQYNTWLEIGQKSKETRREVTRGLYWVSKYMEYDTSYGRGYRKKGNIFTPFSEKYYTENKINPKYPDDEQYERCREVYKTWIKEQEGLEIYNKEETKALRKEYNDLDTDRKYPKDDKGNRQYNLYLSDYASKSEKEKNKRLLKKGEGKQETPLPSERELYLKQELDRREKVEKRISSLISSSNKKTKDHVIVRKEKGVHRDVLEPTIWVCKDALNFFRLKSIDKEKNRATNLGEKATHYKNSTQYCFIGTHSVSELEAFARGNGYKPKPKDKYEDYKNWLIENLYKKN